MFTALATIISALSKLMIASSSRGRIRRKIALPGPITKERIFSRPLGFIPAIRNDFLTPLCSQKDRISKEYGIALCGGTNSRAERIRHKAVDSAVKPEPHIIS